MVSYGNGRLACNGMKGKRGIGLNSLSNAPSLAVDSAVLDVDYSAFRRDNVVLNLYGYLPVYPKCMAVWEHHVYRVTALWSA